MHNRTAGYVLASLLLAGTSAYAQQTPPPASQPFAAGPPLKLSANTKVYGSFRFAESVA